MTNKWTIAVLLGGRSAERQISLQSGAAVAHALHERGHRTLLVDPQDQDLRTFDWSAVDVAFLALHGEFGEDGEVQTLLEGLGVPYTGSGPEASRRAFSKLRAKECFLEQGVPTPDFTVVQSSDTTASTDETIARCHLPCVVKPDRQGSSHGISIVRKKDTFPAALETCFSLDDTAVIERFIEGTEWTVTLLDDRVLPVVQIAAAGEFYDFAAKYESDETAFPDAAGHSSQMLKRIADVGAAAAQSVGAEGLVRVDIRLDDAAEPWVLEVNTIPGMTDHSLAPRAAAQIGWSLGELCERCILSGLHRQR